MSSTGGGGGGGGGGTGLAGGFFAGVAAGPFFVEEGFVEEGFDVCPIDFFFVVEGFVAAGFVGAGFEVVCASAAPGPPSARAHAATRAVTAVVRSREPGMGGDSTRAAARPYN